MKNNNIDTQVFRFAELTKGRVREINEVRFKAVKNDYRVLKFNSIKMLKNWIKKLVEDGITFKTSQALQDEIDTFDGIKKPEMLITVLSFPNGSEVNFEKQKQGDEKLSAVNETVLF